MKRKTHPAGCSHQRSQRSMCFVLQIGCQYLPGIPPVLSSQYALIINNRYSKTRPSTSQHPITQRAVWSELAGEKCWGRVSLHSEECICSLVSPAPRLHGHGLHGDGGVEDVECESSSSQESVESSVLVMWGGGLAVTPTVRPRPATGRPHQVPPWSGLHLVF